MQANPGIDEGGGGGGGGGYSTYISRGSGGVLQKIFSDFHATRELPVQSEA